YLPISSAAQLTVLHSAREQVLSANQLQVAKRRTEDLSGKSRELPVSEYQLEHFNVLHGVANVADIFARNEFPDRLAHQLDV
ncbi:hypothetical protein PENTCL1PPCAC_14002, partial [Pristionchus entomophagus]